MRLFILFFLFSSVLFAQDDPFADFFNDAEVIKETDPFADFGETTDDTDDPFADFEEDSSDDHVFSSLIEIEAKQGFSVVNKYSSLNRDNIFNATIFPFDFYIAFNLNYFYKNIFEFNTTTTLKIQNPTNRLVNETKSGDLEHMNLDHYADVFLNFSNLNFKYIPLPEFYMQFGYQNIKKGFSTAFSPNSALTMGKVGIDQYQAGFLALLFGGQVDFFNYSFYYLPSVDFDTTTGDATQKEVERYFSFVETPNVSQIMGLDFGFYFYGVNWQFNFNMREKDPYTFDDFYFSGGTGISYSVFPNWELHSEYQLGTGFDNMKTPVYRDNTITTPAGAYTYTYPEYENSRANTLYHQFVFGTKFSFGGVDFNLDYIYNGAGFSSSEHQTWVDSLNYSHDRLADPVGGIYKGYVMSSSQNINPFYLSRHFLFLDIQARGVANFMDIQNVLIFSPSDLGVRDTFSIDFNITDGFSVGLDLELNTGKKDSSFASLFSVFTGAISIAYSF